MKKFVLQVWEDGRYVTKTKPQDYWTTCKEADIYKKPDSLTGWCRVAEVGDE
jgi:hypothetical protein